MRSEGCQFGEQTFHTESVCLLDRKCFSKQLHRQPKQRAATSVFASAIELSGTFGKPRFPAGPQLDVKEPQAPRRDFVLMRNARGPEHQRHGRELFLLAAVAFAVKAAEQQTEKGQFVRVHRQLARDRMSQIAEDRPGMLQAMADRAEELAALEAGFAIWNELRTRHGNSLRGKMLLLF